jgi:hypothetical protein
MMYSKINKILVNVHAPKLMFAWIIVTCLHVHM